MPAYVEMAYWHGLYDLDTYNDIYKNGCPKEFEYVAVDPTNLSDTCAEYFVYFQSLVQGINVYNVYGKCYGVEEDSKIEPSLYASNSDIGFTKVGNEIKTYKKSASAADYTSWVTLNPRPDSKKL